MADGLREVVGDPLAFNPNAKGADRSLPTYGVRNPQASGGNEGYKQAIGALGILDGISATIGQIAAAQADTATVDGKIAYATGKTQADIAATGNTHMMQGWQAMDAAGKGNQFLTEEAQFIDNDGKTLDPVAYNQRLKQRQKEYFDTLPNDPIVRKTALAQFEDYGPRLASAQVKAHNDYNEQQGIGAASNYLATGAHVQTDATYPVLDGQLRVSDSVVAPAIKNYTPTDVDVLTRTILGEAGGEGPGGMAAVASVIVNRTQDPRYPHTVSAVAQQDKQFSTWNSADNGGNNPLRFDVNSPAYKQAQQIAQAVMDGHVVDQTGGSTHFYAPKGMKDGKEPDWFASEASKSGKAIKIGGHVFTGSSAAVTAQTAGGNVVFTSNAHDNINPELAGVLAGASAALGTKLVVTSGYRSPDSSVEAAKGNGGGEHTHGSASDISMAGMNEERRAALVRELQARGAKRFITYSNDKDMLHVDLKDQTGTGASWFMFDKHAANMKNAPQWFKDVAASPPTPPSAMAGPGAASQAAASIGLPTDENAPVRPGSTRIQEFMRNSPLSRDGKAKAISDAMERTLSSGDDTLFNDAGGVSGLLAYGATPEQVDRIQKAKLRFDGEQEKNYDADKAKWRAGILAKATSGGFPDVNAGIDEITARFNDKRLSDTEAKSLANEVTTEINKSANSADSIIPLELRDIAAQQYNGIETGRLQAHEAGQNMMDAAKRLGVKSAVANNLVASMYAKQEQHENELKSELKAQMAKNEKDAIVDKTVKSALARGTGLKGLTGTITSKDEDGMTQEIPAVQYGINTLKKSVQDRYAADVQAGRIKPEEAGPAAVKEVYENLAKQDVPDTKFGNAMASAVTGTVVGKDGTVNPQALDALDQYMQMSNNPKIGSAYMAKMIQNDEARTFFETAKQFYAGDTNMDSAIRRASERLNGTVDAQTTIERTAKYTTNVNKAVTETVATLSDDSTFWSSMLGTASAYTQDSIKDVMTHSSDVIKGYIQQKADIFHHSNNREPMEVSVEKAKVDAANDGVIIGNQVVMGSYTAGERLDQKMFGRDNQFTKDDPQKALDWKLAQVAGTPEVWGSLWAERVPQGKGVFAGGDFGGNPKGLFRDKQTPPYEVTYDGKTGTMLLRLYKDASRTETVGNTIPIDVKKLGDEYKHVVSRGESNMALDAWRVVKEGMAQGLNMARAVPGSGQPGENTAPANPGFEIGKMFKPKQ